MKIETLCWLFPVVFIIHDFEEIIMMRPWISKNSQMLKKRFPVLYPKFISKAGKLSTSSFALVVLEEFILLVIITYITVEYGFYSMWTGLLMAFFLHLIIHLIQSLVVRIYTPFIITSMLASGYCIFAIISLQKTQLVDWKQTLYWTVFFFITLVANLLFVHKMAGRFEKWLNEKYDLQS